MKSPAAGRSMVAMRRLRALTVAPLLAACAVVASAEPASAHGTSRVQPTNYRTRVDAIDPAVAGLSVVVVDLGEHLELRNDTGEDIVVLGYESEPYLRIGPAGVFENIRSPATYLNEVGDPADARVPDSADPAAKPAWEKVGPGSSGRWREHRAHWTGNEDPPAVRRDPGSRHVVQDWKIELRRRGERIVVTGAVVWVPGPSPWPGLAAAAGLAGAVLIVSRTRRWPGALAVALALAMVTAALELVGSWGATTSSAATKLGAAVYAMGGVVIGAGALAWLVRRRDPYDATPAVLVAGIFVAVASGLANLASLNHSQLPSTLPAGLVRLQVVVSVGLGMGLVLAAALRLRRPEPFVAEPRPEAVTS
jgi:hypothetical protein